MSEIKNYPPFSVLISLYQKEKPANFDACMQSMVTQTVLPAEIVVVLDGPITPELENVLDQYVRSGTPPVRVIRCEENRGLGVALAVGVPECACDLIARMDTDDISRSDRFEKQLDFFAGHPELDICGSQIAEFEGTPDNIVCVRKVPTAHEDIARYQKTRSAFNHVSVMFKKKAVLDAGNYRSMPFVEDDDLWIRMLQTGARCANIDDELVYVRIDGGMIERRGGLRYFRQYRSARKAILDTGYISYWDYLKTVIVQLGVSLMPVGLRRLIFIKALRR